MITNACINSIPKKLTTVGMVVILVMLGSGDRKIAGAQTLGEVPQVFVRGPVHTPNQPEAMTLDLWLADLQKNWASRSVEYFASQSANSLNTNLDALKINPLPSLSCFLEDAYNCIQKL